MCSCIAESLRVLSPGAFDANNRNFIKEFSAAAAALLLESSFKTERNANNLLLSSFEIGIKGWKSKKKNVQKKINKGIFAEVSIRLKCLNWR